MHEMAFMLTAQHPADGATRVFRLHNRPSSYQHRPVDKRLVTSPLHNHEAARSSPDFPVGFREYQAQLHGPSSARCLWNATVRPGTVARSLLVVTTEPHLRTRCCDDLAFSARRHGPPPHRRKSPLAANAPSPPVRGRSPRATLDRRHRRRQCRS
jgi:hypothetical protein